MQRFGTKKGLHTEILKIYELIRWTEPIEFIKTTNLIKEGKLPLSLPISGAGVVKANLQFQHFHRFVKSGVWREKTISSWRVNSKRNSIGITPSSTYCIFPAHIHLEASIHKHLPCQISKETDVSSNSKLYNQLTKRQRERQTGRKDTIFRWTSRGRQLKTEQVKTAIHKLSSVAIWDFL